MIYDIFEKDILTIPADMVLCPVSPVGILPQAAALGFNEVYPELALAVNQANNLNDFAPGVLLCQKAGNVVGDRYIVGIPMCAHPRERLDPYYLSAAGRSLRKLILDIKPRTITLPAEAFYESIDSKAGVVSKHDLAGMLLSVLNGLPAGRSVNFLIVHDKDL